MRRAVIAVAALGSGTLLTFVLAGLAFLASPEGRLVPVSRVDPFAVELRGRAEPGIVLPDRAPGFGAAPAVDPEMVKLLQEKLRANDADGDVAEPQP